MTNKALVDLAAQISGLQEQVASLSQPSLGYSSLEDGAIAEYDLGGTQVAQYGKQFDGTHVAASLGGPPPPTPSAPTVTPVNGGLKVSWDGLWADALYAPMDFARVEVHVGQDPDFDAYAATYLRGTIESPRGGDVVVVPLPYVEHTVTLVARTMSGNASVASARVVGTPTKITELDLDFDPSSLAGSTIYWGDEPADPAEGDFWLQPPDNALTRWDGDSWEDVSDQGITEAIQAAAAAQGAADAASGQASAAQAAADLAAGQAAQALTEAQTAQSTADGKAVIYFQASAPTGLTAADLNDLWIDSDDSNKVYAWDGDSWEIAADQRIATAITTATNAQAAVATKVQTFFQATAPTDTGRSVGDLWFDTDDGNKAYRWDGTWQVVQDAGIATAVSTASDAASDAAQAQSTASAAQSTANAASTAVATKTTTFSQASAPPTTGRTNGDTWIDTDDGNKIYNWTGAWTARPLGAPAIGATARDLGAITTYFQASQPTGTLKVGDQWVDSDDANKAYRYNGSTWDVITDQNIATALANASAAQSAATSAQTAVATKITAYYQTSAPPTTGRTAGDMWVDTDDGNKIYRWSGSAWTATPFGASAISSVSPGSISAGSLASQVLLASGGRIATAASGARTVMDNTGFSAYNTAGTRTIYLSALDGSAIVTGAYRTAATGRRIEVIPFTPPGPEWEYGSPHAINFWYDEDPNIMLPSTMTASTYTTDSGDVTGTLAIYSGTRKDGSGGSSEVSLNPDRLWIVNTIGGPFNPGESNTIQMDWNGVEVTAVRVALTAGYGGVVLTAGNGGAVQVNGGNLNINTNFRLNTDRIEAQNTGVIFMNPSARVDINAELRVNTIRHYSGSDTTINATRWVWLGAGTTVVSPGVYSYTSGGAANMYITSSGSFCRSTSLEKSKVGIDRSWADSAPLDAIKRLAPATYFDRRNAENYAALAYGDGPDHDADYPRALLGLIAEDVEALGLDLLTTVDEDGKLAGIAYDRLAVALIPWLRDIEKRLAAAGL